jgi:formylmethanofuran dehydrogenase subunit E
MDIILRNIESFHGHLGPYVVIGYRMGDISNKLLGSNPFTKIATVWTKEKPPMSCVIDGIQMSSGCTLGKGTITIRQGNIPKVEFTNNDGKKIQIKLKHSIKHEIDTRVSDENLKNYSEEIFQRSDSELFDISP